MRPAPPDKPSWNPCLFQIAISLQFVIPAKAGIRSSLCSGAAWMPACAGMTVFFSQLRSGRLCPLLVELLRLDDDVADAGGRGRHMVEAVDLLRAVAERTAHDQPHH